MKEQVLKSKIVWEELDEKWLSLYIHLNRDLCSDINKISHLLPRRRRGRRGPEAGMGSEECRQREIDETEDSNWEWPMRQIFTKEDKRLLMGAALEIAVVFFFQNFTCNFGGKIFVQKFGDRSE